MKKTEKIKTWMKLNKNASIYISIMVIYTLVMLGVIIAFGGELSVCKKDAVSKMMSGQQGQIESAVTSEDTTATPGETTIGE